LNEEYEKLIERVAEDPAKLVVVLLGVLAIIGFIFLGVPYNYILVIFCILSIILVRSKPEVFRKRTFPLPDFLEPILGNVCARCGKRVKRGTLKKKGKDWVCEECYSR